MAPRKTKPAGASGRVRLDGIDRAILAALRGHGRLTYRELSERVSLSPRAALERVRRLEARGVIRGYTALLDAALLGYGVVALAAVELRENAARSRQGLERVLKRAPEVVELQVVSGSADYLARIVSASLEAYEALTAGWLADPALGIARITTTFVLRSLKDFQGYPAPDAEAHDTI